ncbi:hypothetical protein DASC09_029270 [Saccharomycopsis crataegensis]|uniref:C2H2-type domain-containing protein n=1 Tax=Saccharomycopsis crataegensis TaxID=43959 RepID=A0AAV5QM23_9ASCO|nr:hypothetical protein DASC09_029270 [Saccharomycopsis crataegensis]
MTSLSSERFSYDYNSNKKVISSDSGSVSSGSATPRRSIKIDSLLNDSEESSPNAFPLFSSFNRHHNHNDNCHHEENSNFHSTTASMNDRMILARPITPFESFDSRSSTPLSSLARPFTPVSKTSTFSSNSSSISCSPISAPLTPLRSFDQHLASPPAAPKRLLDEPLSFESHTGVLDFGPLNLKLITTTSSESKLLNFDLSPTGTTTENILTSSKSVNFYTSRFISNPDIFKNRKFQCKVCDKRFKTTGHLTRHKKIHSGEKKFECSWPGCSSRFSRKDNCMQHYRTHNATSNKSKKLELDINVAKAMAKSESSNNAEVKVTRKSSMKRRSI